MMGAGRHESWNSRVGRNTTVDLVGQGSAVIGDDRAGDRLEKNPVLIGDLLRMPDKNASGPINHMGFDAGSDQPDDLFLETLPIAVATFVPDHQVDGQALEAPVSMRLHELADEFDIGGVGDLQQDDGQVTGDRVAP